MPTVSAHFLSPPFGHRSYTLKPDLDPLCDLKIFAERATGGFESESGVEEASGGRGLRRFVGWHRGYPADEQRTDDYTCIQCTAISE